jgi:rubrerythrin
VGQDLKSAEYLEDRPLDPDAGLQDIVIYAMHREEEARDFYRRMADSAPGAELRELFGKLAAMERSHKGRLEEFYEQRLMGDG